MTVYVIHSGKYMDADWVGAVFSSREQAEEARKEYIATWECAEAFPVITALELDEKPEYFSTQAAR